MAKQYGLIIPNKGHKIGQITARPSIFVDSDSDTPDIKPTGSSKTLKKQDKINQEKAVTEDPTVYQYDEIFDEMDQKRKQSKLARKDLDRKPKYINKLLVTAEKRKRENERRIERQVQKEREEEGDMFKDKESFITSAYKKKLEEMRELEEQEKREEYLEGIGDVRKQGNLDGFYRHLYDQKLNYEEKEEKPIIKEEIKEEPESDNVANESNLSEHIPEKVSEPNSVKVKSTESVKKRKYRARRDSQNESEDEPVVKKGHLSSNLDADSDFSIDSSDSENEEEKSNKTKEVPKVKTTDDKSPNENSVKEEKQVLPKGEEEKVIEVKPKKPKVDIWKKRTVGEKFEEAVKKFFERKASREMGP
nr:nuclear speckle splicing regulatory protein 1 [Leptinotarsa decemlineata]